MPIFKRTIRRVTFSRLCALVCLTIGGSAFAAEGQPTVVPTNIDSVLRLPDPTAKPNWSDDVIARIHLSSALGDGASTVSITGDELLSSIDERFLNRRTFLHFWQLENKGSWDYVPTFVSKRGEALTLATAVTAGRILLNQIAASEIPASVSEKRVDYAVRSVLIQVAQMLKLVGDLKPNVLVPLTNEEIYPQFVKEFGKNRSIPVTFDWTGNSDRLTQLKREAQAEEKSVKWGDVEVNLPQLAPDLAQFREQMKQSLQFHYDRLVTAQKQDLLLKTYGEKWKAPLVRVAKDPALQRQTFAQIKDHLWEAKVSTFVIAPPPEIAFLAAGIGKDVVEASRLATEELAKHPELNADRAQEKDFSTRYLDVVESTVKKAGLRTSQVRVDHQSFLSFGRLTGGKELDRQILEIVRRELLTEPPTGKVVTRSVRLQGGVGYIWIVIEKKTPLASTHPEVKKEIQSAINARVEGFWIRQALLEAITDNPVEVVTKTSSEWGWPDLTVSPAQIAAWLMPVTFQADKASAQEIQDIQAGRQALEIKDLARIQDFSRANFDATLARP